MKMSVGPSICKHMPVVFLEDLQFLQIDHKLCCFPVCWTVLMLANAHTHLGSVNDQVMHLMGGSKWTCSIFVCSIWLLLLWYNLDQMLYSTMGHSPCGVAEFIVPMYNCPLLGNLSSCWCLFHSFTSPWVWVWIFQNAYGKEVMEANGLIEVYWIMCSKYCITHRSKLCIHFTCNTQPTWLHSTRYYSQVYCTFNVQR